MVRPGDVRAHIDPTDPAHVLLEAVDAMTKQSHKDLSALVTKLSDDVAASSVLAEQAARTKAEVIVTKAGEWAAEKIREAANMVQSNLELELSTAELLVKDVRRLLFLTITINACLTTLLLVGMAWRFL